MKLFVCLLAALPVLAAPVTITGTIRRPDNQLATGLATIELNAPCVDGSGNLILDRALTVRFDSGAFSVQLEPTTVCPITTYYRVRYRVDRVWISAFEFWSVPPSPTTTTIQAVRLQEAAPPVFARATTKGDISVFDGVTWQKLPKGTDGQVLKADSGATLGVSWAADGGGGGSTTSWTTSLNFGTLIDTQCAEQSFSATGLTLGTPLVVTPPGGLGSVSFTAWASSLNVATVRACYSGGGVAVSGSFTVQVARWTSTLNFGTLIDSQCADQTFAASGLAVGTPLVVIPPAGVGSADFDAWASAAGTAKVRACFSDGQDTAVSGSFTVQAASGYLSASGALDFPNIIAGGFQSLTLTVAGATTSMGAAATPPAALAGQLRVSASVTAANTVTITLENLSDQDIDPASGTFLATVIQ